jgi:hypothetical protein
MTLMNFRVSERLGISWSDEQISVVQERFMYVSAIELNIN